MAWCWAVLGVGPLESQTSLEISRNIAKFADRVSRIWRHWIRHRESGQGLIRSSPPEEWYNGRVRTSSAYLGKCGWASCIIDLTSISNKPLDSAMVAPRGGPTGPPEPRSADWDAMLSSVKATTAALASTMDDAQQLLAEDALLFDRENDREWNGRPLARPEAKVCSSALA